MIYQCHGASHDVFTMGTLGWWRCCAWTRSCESNIVVSDGGMSHASRTQATFPRWRVRGGCVGSGGGIVVREWDSGVDDIAVPFFVERHESALSLFAADHALLCGGAKGKERS
jgi:hypothetical protein